jgi:hypothetical protein
MMDVNCDSTERMSRYRDDSKWQNGEDPRELSTDLIRLWKANIFYLWSCLIYVQRFAIDGSVSDINAKLSGDSVCPLPRNLTQPRYLICGCRLFQICCRSNICWSRNCWCLTQLRTLSVEWERCFNSWEEQHIVSYLRQSNSLTLKRICFVNFCFDIGWNALNDLLVPSKRRKWED